jgi:V-type H+-transporting ATPase subunit C
VAGPEKAAGAFDGAVAPFTIPGSAVNAFNVPQGDKALKFGSFDNLIKFTDELQKQDSSVEGVLRRLERQWLEIDEQAKFEVISGAGSSAQTQSLDRYLGGGWAWNEQKFSSSKTMQATNEFVMRKVNETDELMRAKSSAYSETKTQKQSLTKREGVPFPQRDLIDMFTPDIVGEFDFVETEHLTTLVVILTRGQDKDFLGWYQEPQIQIVKMVEGKEVTESSTLDSDVQGVVPESAKKFNFPGEGSEDKDGNTVWRIVLFKSAKKKFMDLARHQKFTVRDFVYSADGHKQLNDKRASVDLELQTQHGQLKDFCRLAWSDVFVCWLHIKAMRVFVEGVLRFGLDKKLSAIILAPKPTATTELRKALARALGPRVAKMQEDADADGEEYFPYVSLAFTPCATAASA